MRSQSVKENTKLPKEIEPVNETTRKLYQML